MAKSIASDIYLVFTKCVASLFVDFFSSHFCGILENNDNHLIGFKGFYLKKTKTNKKHSIYPKTLYLQC